MIGKRWVALVLACAACGSSKKPEGAGAASGTDAAVLAPLTPPPLGVDAVKRMNFPYGEGAADYAHALAAAKKQAWPDVEVQAEAAVKKDPSHLDAQRLLGVALAQTGDRAGAAQHLAIALAGDPLKYGPALGADGDLTAFLATPEGAQVTALAGTLVDAARKLAATAPLVIARRSTFKLPSKSGYASSRGELYALDVDASRFVRLTHTDDQVVAWLPSSTGAELAVIGFDKLELPAAAVAPPGGPTPGSMTRGDAPVLLGRTWIETLDAKTLAPTGKRATIPKARAVGVYYAAGDQLVAIAYPGSGRWDRGDGVAYSIDRATGKAQKTKAPAPAGAQALVSLDDGAVEVPAPGVDATWAGDPRAADELTVTPAASTAKKTIAVPGSGKALRGSIVVSPGGARIAFVTWADPCATDGSLPSLYAVDVASGQLKHILTAASRFGARWIDDTRLVYEDDEGGLRVYDANAGHELVHVTERGGLALRALALSPKPICKTAPPAQVPAAGSGSGSGSASDEAMPPEEPAAAP